MVAASAAQESQDGQQSPEATVLSILQLTQCDKELIVWRKCQSLHSGPVVREEVPAGAPRHVPDADVAAGGSAAAARG